MENYKLPLDVTIATRDGKVYVSNDKVTIALGDFDELFANIQDIYNGEYKEAEPDEFTELDGYDNEMENRGDEIRKGY